MKGNGKMEKCTEYGRRDVVRLLFFMTVAFVYGCDQNSIEITDVTFTRRPLRILVRFRLTGSSSSSLMSATLRGTLEGEELLKVSGKVQGSTIEFKVKMKGQRALTVLKNAAMAGELRGTLKLDAVLDTPMGNVSVSDQWSGELG